MANADKLLESVKFLLKSVKQLSDRFVEADAKLTSSFDGVASDVSDLLERVERIEKELVEYRDVAVLHDRLPVSPELPVREGTSERVVPAINLSTQEVIGTYECTPTLLEPFSRPCAVSGRTLSGEIDQVELELFAQGTTWALEALEGGWILVPRPGSLERRVQIQSLERLFEINGITNLPATLYLLAPATAVAVEYGRRWQLLHKGRLSIQPDPLQQGTGQRLLAIEQRLAKLEESFRA